MFRVGIYWRSYEGFSLRVIHLGDTVLCRRHALPTHTHSNRFWLCMFTPLFIQIYRQAGRQAGRQADRQVDLIDWLTDRWIDRTIDWLTDQVNHYRYRDRMTAGEREKKQVTAIYIYIYIYIFISLRATLKHVVSRHVNCLVDYSHFQLSS